MILGVFKAGAKGFTLSGNEQAPAAESLKSTQKPTPRTIAIIGLGYVGLPLALTFGRQYPTIGFDINPTRINELQQKLDSSGECTLQDFLQAPLAHFSNDPKHLAQATIYLIAVPTPITHDKLPDLSYLQSACELVGSVLKVGDIVVFESTTYPTCTRTFCVPLLESTSNLELNRDFFVGYSPERINPADKAHRLSQVVKITSGSTPESAAIIDKLYASVIPAGTHCVSSIEVAEASKALENAQRDINIAFMNEAYMLFDTLGLDMAEILQAARSKWNFLPFYPGLVGGHCISVDPYYLSYIAELKGFMPQIITSSRQTNEAMPCFIASKFAKQLESAGIELQGARVLVVGFAFKKDCKDMRNTLVPNLCDELGGLGLEVEVIDSLIDKEQARLEYGISVLESSQLLAHSYDGVLCNVIHSCDSAIDFQRFCKINGVFMSISLDKA
ncbi:nucleotide sugar dehydrogenase [Helicobacter sp. XJK30-2]|uniref:Nucleotide sugar dehydrogenase n=1 Tax=Helicobacter zhangjianzhongii TaxID=2974574 RepID=A0ACC6FQZ0_9HELI|nr:nucleotide sugar dehydrogenase [Helicobacter sp. XJK30-2]MDL0081614.1 nucleotide sugar dehydrogenase [Helicobacter sp. XJK30-2]